MPPKNSHRISKEAHKKSGKPNKHQSKTIKEQAALIAQLQRQLAGRADLFVDAEEHRNRLLEQLHNLPTINPFMVVAKMVVSKSSSLSYEDAEEAVENTMAEVLVGTTTTATTLKFAGENEYFNMNAEHHHEDAVLRHLTASLVIRYHFLTEEQIAELTIPTRFLDTSGGREAMRKQTLKWQTSFQSSIMKIYFQALTIIVDKAGGVDLWKAATIKQRAEMFKKMWSSNKKMMATAALGTAACHVPIDDIFGGSTEIYKRWQHMHKTVFVWVCEMVFEHRIGGKTDDKESVFRYWRGMMYLPAFCEGGALDLRGFKIYRSSRGSVYDTDRRKAPLVANIDHDGDAGWTEVHLNFREMIFHAFSNMVW